MDANNDLNLQDLRIQITQNDKIHVMHMTDINALDGDLSPLTPLPLCGPTTLNRSKGQVSSVG
jgi:hypothetical protein